MRTAHTKREHAKLQVFASGRCCVHFAHPAITMLDIHLALFMTMVMMMGFHIRKACKSPVMSSCNHLNPKEMLRKP